jgi:hypothetical protein
MNGSAMNFAPLACTEKIEWLILSRIVRTTTPNLEDFATGFSPDGPSLTVRSSYCSLQAMKHTILLGAALVAVCAMAAVNAVARGGGGGGRSSAAHAASSRSMPSNYGSLRSTSTPNQPARISDAGQHLGESRTVETRRGGDAAVAVLHDSDVGIRGESARGRDDGAQVKDGDRIVAGQTPRGDVAARVRGDGDGVIEVLPNGARPIHIRDDVYYCHDHHYYWPYYYGASVYYQEVYPPYGATADDLPPSAESITVGDTVYYLYDGVYYVKEGSQYVVSNPPDETAAGAPAQPAPNPADLMRAMCAHVAAFTNFVVDCTEQVDRPGKGPTTLKRRILICHPDRILAVGRDGSVATRFWYDGKTVSILDEGKNVYSVIDAPATIEAMLDTLQKDYGTTIPLADLLLPNLCDELGPALDTIKYAGTEKVEGKDCHKMTLMTDDYYAQLWIDADANSQLPRKVDIVYMTQDRKPQYVGIINAWEGRTNIDQRAFTFSPPAGAQRIEMLKKPE